MKLEGSLDAFSLPDVFQLLSLTKKSGGLHLANGQVHGVVYFAGGAITGATSDQVRQGLARRLVGMGVCDDGALRRAVERALSEPVGVARALVESGSVDVDVVRAYAAEQTVDAVFDLLRWPEGSFAFAVDEPDPDAVGIALPADEVVAEATRRRETWESVSRIIPSPDVVLEMPVMVPDPPTLTRDEWALLSLVDGSRSVGELVEVSGAGPFGVVSMLATMVQRGLLGLKDDETPDHVALVRRRQVLLRPLEADLPASVDTGTGSAPGEAAAPMPAHALPPGGGLVPTTVPPVDPVVDPLVDPISVPDAQQVASLELPLLGGAHAPVGVVPPRPEPFLPRRPVEHPEPVASSHPFTPAPAVSPAAAVGSGVGPQAGLAARLSDPAIERDPSVNRSLLLRLIAGVRGL